MFTPLSPITVSHPFLNRDKSVLKQDSSIANLNISSSNILPKRIFSLIVPGIIKGSCSTYAIDPFMDLVPYICLVSSKIEYNKVVFPEPT